MYIYQVINEFTSELEELSLFLWLTELSTITFLNLILVKKIKASKYPLSELN
jgi:hypothetical protein